MLSMVRSGLKAVVGGYMFGMIPSADIATRLAGGPDLRAAGSGNPGATNAAQVLGPKAGLGVLAADIAKGVAAGRWGMRQAGSVGSQLVASSSLAQASATAAVIGHCWPVWNGFHGGKGVATSVGQVLATHPAYFPIDLAVALGTAVHPRWKQQAFAANSAASVAWVVSSVVWWRRALPTLWGPPATMALPIGALVSSAVIASRFLAAVPPNDSPPSDPLADPPHEAPKAPGDAPVG